MQGFCIFRGDFMTQYYMQRALQLAELGRGHTNPNPMVGAVIVKNNKIIGEGYHQYCGGLHAERNAFLNCLEDPSGADLYVTLEPCCHHGRTPPCTDIIIEKNIKNVFIGSTDPNSLVAGKGIALLREKGIQVQTGILKEKCDDLNTVFFHYIKTKQPYVVMKYAMTADGKIATVTGDSKWITSQKAREQVHHMRNALSAIMVGIGTVIADNPLLNCRIPGGKNPIRIICDSTLKIPLTSQIVQTAKEIPTIIAFAKQEHKKQQMLEKAGIQLLYLPNQAGKVDLKALMKVLGEQEIDSVLLEGGATLNACALEYGIVQKIAVYIAPKIFGGNQAKTPIGGKGISFAKDAYGLCFKNCSKNGEDLLLEYDVKKEGEPSCLQES